MSDLFSQSHAPDTFPVIENLAPGIVLIKGMVQSLDFIKATQTIINQAPLRHMMTPMGHPTKVSMSNCGPYGWVSNLQGYGYSATDPLTHKPWPSMPLMFIELAQQAAKLVGIDDFTPDACLINQYEIGCSLGRHQDKDEADFQWPIVSVSLGLQAVFQVFSTNERSAHPYSHKNLPKNDLASAQYSLQKAQDILLQDGDILVLHGPARLRLHGIKSIKADLLQPKLKYRYNLTFRKAR